MPGFIRKILIAITSYAWLILLAGPGLVAFSLYNGWVADGGHAYAAREKLHAITGTVVDAAEVTVKKKRRSTKHFYQISVQPEGGGDPQKLRIDHSTPPQIVATMIDEQVTVLADLSDNNMVYEVSIDGNALISYEDTRARLQADVTASAESIHNAALWLLAAILMLIGSIGVWINRRLRARQAAADTPAVPA